MFKAKRIVCWFSCGAASAVATKLAIAESKNSGIPIVIAYTKVMEEHPDNMRFLKECEAWFGMPIQILCNEQYEGSINNVFLKTRFLVSPQGAACTRLLKKEVRKSFEEIGDRQVFGYTFEEQSRVDRFIDANADVDIWPILIEKNLSKMDCLAILKGAGIELPSMYKLGYKNNNCIGCVKGGAGYWNKIRVDFPEVFEQRAQTEKLLNRKIVKVGEERVFLHDLPVGIGDYEAEMDIECGIFCQMAEQDIKDVPR